MSLRTSSVADAVKAFQPKVNQLSIDDCEKRLQ